MADNKNTILVYSDWIEKFEALTDEEAGKLIKHFFRYVNDLDPVAPDRVTELSFIDIKNSLKRDLKKWEDTLETRSINGRLGNLKRWNNDLFLKVQSNEITLEEAEEIANNRKKSHSDKTNRTATKNVANIAVIDSVIVSVIDNDILLEKESKEYLCPEEKNKNFNNKNFEEKKEKKVPRKKENFGKKEFKESLLSLGANEKHIDDWFAVRDKKLAVYTESSLNLFLNECNSNNFEVAIAVKICAERGWQGFKFEWTEEYKTQASLLKDKPVIGRQSQEIVHNNFKKFYHG